MEYKKIQIKKRAEILNEIYIKNKISRIDIARNLGITPATTTEITRMLLDEGVIEEIDEKEVNGSPGRNKVLLDVKGGHCLYLGAEISYGELTMVIADNMGQVYAKERAKIDYGALSEDEIVAEIKDKIEGFRKGYEIEAVGFALPGQFSEKNDHIITELDYFSGINLAKIKADFDLPLHFLNNAKCMSLAHLFFDEGQTEDTFLFLHIRNGLFLVNIYKGDFYGENNMLIGEIGHMVVDPNGERCECGKKGCFQTIIANSRLIRKAREVYEADPDSDLRILAKSADEISIETLIRAYKLGDRFAIKLLEEAIEALSIIINNLMILIDSNRLVIHYQLLNDEGLKELLYKKIEENASLLNMRNPQEQVIKTYDPFNGAIGAVGLCVKNELIYKNYEDK